MIARDAAFALFFALVLLDDDILAVSPATTYRILEDAGRLDRNRWAPRKKGAGFVQPDAPHRHWHVDVSHLNLGGTFYFLRRAGRSRHGPVQPRVPLPGIPRRSITRKYLAL